MTPAAINLAVAKLEGWLPCERRGRRVWYDPEGGHEDAPPCFVTDGDAIRRVVAKQTPQIKIAVAEYIFTACPANAHPWVAILLATPALIAEALLSALGLNTENK